MLILSRKVNERIVIGDSIVVTVVRIEGGSIRLGIEAPREIGVARGELLRNIAAAIAPAERPAPAR